MISSVKTIHGQFNGNRFKTLLCVFAFSYICVALFLYRIYPLEIPSTDSSVIQWVLLLFFVVFLLNSIKLSVNGIIVTILIYQLILTISLYGYNVSVAKRPFGYGGVDCFTYLKWTTDTLNVSIKGFILYMQEGRRNISDYGFPFIQRIVIKSAGNVETGLFLMCIFNAVSMTIGAGVLYKLALYFVDHTGAKAAALLWGLNSVSIFCNVSGLKESIFTTLIILTMFYMYRLFERKKISNIFPFLIFLLTTVFFRWYLTAFFVIIFLLKSVYSGYLRRLMPLAIILLTIVAAYTAYFLSSSFFGNAVVGQILGSQESSGGGNTQVLNMIVGFIGPIPNYLASSGTTFYSFIIAPYSGFKLFFSLLTLFGGFYILKNHIVKLFPLLLFVIANILLTIASITSFDYRFSYTMIPFYFILIIYGFSKFRNKYKTIISLSYFFVIFIMIWGYNVR